MSEHKNAQELCTFGIVTALPKEFAAMYAMVDNAQPFHVQSDPNDYAIGTIPWKHGRGEHYVVITMLKKMANNSAAAAATHLLRSFSNVKNVIMVGIAYGMPNIQKADKHVRLGDIVISNEHGVIQSDNIKISDDVTKNRDSSGKPSAFLIGKVRMLEVQRLSRKYPWEEYIERANDIEDTERPSETDDVLYSSVQPTHILVHPPDVKRRTGKPKLHYGRIASANSLMSNSIARDELRDKLDVIAGEMEGSGIADATWIDGKWYLLVRGICDYGDNSKKDKWQGYAAVVAAAYTRALIEICEIDDDYRKTKEEAAQASSPLSTQSRTDATSVANELLDLFSPTAVASLLGPTAGTAARIVAELNKLDRTISSPTPISDAYYALERTPIHSPDSKKTSSFSISSLLTDHGRRHIIIAQSGAGKTHALITMCRKFIDSRDLLPIFIDISIFGNASDVINYIESRFKVSLDILINEFHAVFIFDNWGRFMRNCGQESDTEWRKLLGRLLGARLIVVSHSDTRRLDSFKVWNLDPLPDWTVLAVLGRALPNSSPPHNSVLGLLRLPLLLILYGIIDSPRTTAGILLGTLHQHLMSSTKDHEEFSKILETASAKVTLEGNRKISNFKSVIQNYSHGNNYASTLENLEQRGILRSVSGTIYPLHDLYWDFLVGLGIFHDEALFVRSITNLRIRKSIKLALESGLKATLAYALLAIDTDMILSARIISAIGKRDENLAAAKLVLVEKIHYLSKDDSAENRYRAALASIELKDSSLLDLILSTLSDLQKRRYPLENPLEIDPEFLWECRDLFHIHLGDDAKRGFILSAIEETADARWVAWLEKAHLSQWLTISSAVRTALHCTSELPFWISKALSGNLEDIGGGYTIGSVALRRVNHGLVKWVLLNYNRLLENQTRMDSSFVDLNRVLLNSGEDTYNFLLSNFMKWGKRSQQLLTYCICSMDSAWVARFQSRALGQGSDSAFADLLSIVCEETTDEDVELWLASDDRYLQTLGWKTFVRKRQKEAIPRLISHLPTSFGGSHLIPPLCAIRYLRDAPNELLDELWKRLNGTIEPATFEDFLYAVMSIYPNGVPSVVDSLRRNPFFIPIYHMGRFLQGLSKWESDMGITFMFQHSGKETSFGEWLITVRYAREKDSPFFAQVFRTYSPSHLSDFLLNAYVNGDVFAQDLVTKFDRVGRYHEALVTYLQAQDENSGLWKILNLFRDVLHLFPETKLRQLLDAATKIGSGPVCKILESLLTSGSCVSVEFRLSLASVLLTDATIDFENQARIAKFLSVLPLAQVLSLFKGVPIKNAALFVIRKIEKILGYSLINDDGQLLNNATGSALTAGVS